MIHENASPLAGTTQTIKPNVKDIGGQTIQIEDWYDRVNNRSWMGDNRNTATLAYAWRAGHSGLPLNDEVLQGTIEGKEHIVNVSELAEILN